MTFIKINVKALDTEGWDPKEIVYNSDDEMQEYESDAGNKAPMLTAAPDTNL
jgi:hypothetical protein